MMRNLLLPSVAGTLWLGSPVYERINRGGSVSDPYNRPSVPPEVIDLSYLDRIDNAPEWDSLPMEDQKEFSYYSKTNPEKTKRVIYLIRRRT